MIPEYILSTPFFIVRTLQITITIVAVNHVIKRFYNGPYPRFDGVKGTFLQSHLLRRPNNSDSGSSHSPSTRRISITSSCSTVSDSESSILAYVSTLFLEDADDTYSNQQDECNTPQQELQSKDGLVARILPSDQFEYERCKPRSRRCNAVALRQQLDFQNPNEPFPPIVNENDEFSVKSRQKQRANEAADDLVVLLQVNITVPSPSISTVLHCVEMCMQREAKEAANRSLQRLPMSLENKLKKQERLLNRSGRKSLVEDTFTAMQASIWIPNDEATPEEESVSISCAGEDGYRRYPLTNEISSATLWNDLSRPRSTVLLPKLCMTYNDGKMGPPICMPIIACPPTIMSVHTFEDFEARVFVGVPLAVEAHILHATRAVIVWFADGVEVCRDSYSYTPTKADTGKLLSVLIIPIRPGHSGEGYEEAFEYQNPVEALPSLPLIHPMRDAWTIRDQDSAPDNELRVLSYNLLADLYASREDDRMYNHCPVEFLSRERRMPLLLYETLVYQPDVICLQEVDPSIFSGLFRPCLESQGYQGYYSNKASVQLEGCAMFWSLRRFEQVDDSAMQDFALGDLFHKCKAKQLCRWDSLDDIDRFLDSNQELSRVVREKVGQVLQVAELRLRSTSISDHPTRIVVGNTHLFYHPLADHIRAMQAWIVCRQMDIVRRRHGAPCPLLLCGDFNSGPLSGAVHLLLGRKVGPEHRETWKHFRDYEWAMGDQDFLLEHGYIGNNVDTETPMYEEEAFEDARQYIDPEDGGLDELELSQPPQIRLPPSFPSLVSGYPEIPEFTNFAIDFKETLDYILASKPSETELYGLNPKDSAPTPTSEMMKTYAAMPNEFMPSDHISLVCDFKWQRY